MNLEMKSASFQSKKLDQILYGQRLSRQIPLGRGQNQIMNTFQEEISKEESKPEAKVGLKADQLLRKISQMQQQDQDKGGNTVEPRTHVELTESQRIAKIEEATKKAKELLDAQKH